MTEHEPPIPVLEMSRRTFVRAVVVLWAAVLVVQAVTALRTEISVRDACGLYLTFAREAAAGRWETAQHVGYPPGYGVLTGLVSRAVPWARDPAELAGKIVNFVWFHVALTCVLAVGAVLWSRRVGLAAMGLAAFNSVLLPMSVSASWELEFGAVLMLAITVIALTRDRLRWWAAAVLGVLGGLAPLFRSEGFVVPLLLPTAVAIVHLRRPGARPLKLAAACGLMLALSAAIVAPRVRFVYDRTGIPLHDIRMLPILRTARTVPPETWLTPITPPDIGPTIRGSLRGVSYRNYHPNRHDEPGAWAWESVKGLAEGWNPVVLVLAIYGLIRRRPLERHGRIEAAIALLVLPLLASYGYAVFVHARMAVMLAPPMAVLGGVGLVAFAEHVRGRFVRPAGTPRWAAWGGSLRAQLALLALLLAGCSVFCVLGAQRRSASLRYIGEHMLAQYGPGRRILSDTVEPPYYARGWFIPRPAGKRETCDLPKLLDALRESRAEFLLVDPTPNGKDEPWCPQLWDPNLAAEREAARVPLPSGRKYQPAELYDAAKLVRLLSPADGNSG